MCSDYENCKFTQKWQNSECVGIYSKPANGYGIVVINKLGTYRGQFKLYRFEGFGELDYSKRYNKVHKKSRKSYRGFWISGRQSGNGTMLWNTGASYKGNWINGRRQGYGEFLSSHGNIYKGSWMNDRYHGYGEYFYSKTDSESRIFYKGDWVNNRKNGEGVMEWNSNNRASFKKYTGEWKRNAKTGHGFMIYQNGDFYKGDWYFSPITLFLFNLI